MSEFYADDWLTIHGGDARDVLPTLPAESVHCVVTSPPFWGLRDYGHKDQLGLEATPEEYVANLVAVFREVRRVLRADGTVWLNLGDSYASNGVYIGDYKKRHPEHVDLHTANSDRYPQARKGPRGGEYQIKAKDLVGIPWRVAFALQADGWWLRSDIVWSKPNPMPESVTDRPTKAHEYLFLLSKSARYYYDADAVREADAGTDHARSILNGQPSLEPSNGLAGPHTGIRTLDGRNGAGRNLRSVWTIATRPYPGAHFAVFPPELPERCIKAGSPDGGVVLDPFAGSGTVGMVANRLSRRAILIDLNPEYLRQQIRRNAQVPLGV
jgi:DNA modification methylase